MAALKSFNAVTLGELLPDEVLSASEQHLEVSGVQLDSRKVTPGGLFLAMPGHGKDGVDGRDFIASAVMAGAVAVVAERQGWEHYAPLSGSVPVVLVSDLSSQASAIAGRFFGEPGEHVKVIGVTGTNGKTTCSHLLAQLFNQLSEKCGVIGTLGYGIPEASSPGVAGLVSTGLTTPDAIQAQQVLAEIYASGARYVAMEVSSHSLDQGRVKAVPVYGAVFTNLSREHLDYHTTMAEYLAAKQQLFATPGLQFAVINIDDEAGTEIARTLSDTLKCFTYSLRDSSASVYAAGVHLSAHGIAADVVTPEGAVQIQSRLIGEFNLSNLLAVLATALACGENLTRVVSAIGALAPVAGRLEVVDPSLEPQVIIDYAHTPDALEQVLSSLRTIMQAVGKGRLWCVFGCGGDRDQGKRSLMAEVAGRLADEVVVTSDNPRGEVPGSIIDDILKGAERDFHRIEDRGEAISFAIAQAQPGDTVLIAGKGHEDYQLLGSRRIPFSDARQARLALRRRASTADGKPAINGGKVADDGA